MPPDDLGPDPHLNERGVRVSRAQRRTLVLVAVAILAVLPLALAGLATAFPSLL